MLAGAPKGDVGEYRVLRYGGNCILIDKLGDILMQGKEARFAIARRSCFHKQA